MYPLVIVSGQRRSPGAPSTRTELHMVRLAWILVPLLAACGDGNTPVADMSMPVGRCPMPVAPTCTDAQILDLPLFKPASTRAITNSPEGAGFASEIDATGGAGGGIEPKESFVYARFTASGLERVDLGDEAAFNSTGWDIAFRRYVIRLNSGVSGPSCVDGARTAANTDYDTLTAEPAGLEYRTEAYYTSSCSLVPDGSGLGAPGTAL